MQREDIAMGPGAVGDDFGGSVTGAAEGAVEPADQRIKLAGRQLFDAAEIGDDAVAHLSVLVAVALDELEIAAAAGRGDLRVHAATLSWPWKYDQWHSR
uniref:hypothetical protein n=1 Tax=Mangrovicoccus ximenensis TaxID=1911570 RepID=UPI001374AAA6|nr:hypothetical protein [Mangrovicoccus ximenensis]